MTTRGWATLAFRIFGLWCFLHGLTGLVSGYATRPLLLFVPASTSAQPLVTARDLLQAIDDTIWLAVGCYLLFGSGFLINRFCRQVVGRCSVCGYPLTEVTGAVCPECGLPFAPSESTPVV